MLLHRFVRRHHHAPRGSGRPVLAITATFITTLTAVLLISPAHAHIPTPSPQATTSALARTSLDPEPGAGGAVTNEPSGDPEPTATEPDPEPTNPRPQPTTPSGPGTTPPTTRPEPQATQPPTQPPPVTQPPEEPPAAPEPAFVEPPADPVPTRPAAQPVVAPTTPPASPAVIFQNRVPANGSQPRANLERQPSPAAEPVAAGDQGVSPSSSTRDLGIRIFMAGLIGLIISITGLVTIAVRRRQW